MTGGDLEVRRATADDRGAILDLCRSSLGWTAADPDEAFFGWKHDANAFGASPTWIATDPDGRVLGLRVFLRWRFRRPDGTVLRMVRAVDTATHPDARGQGIFSRLTLGALPELADDGVDAVFNTPNDKSMPGYLKMGWTVVGKPPVAARPASIGGLRRTAGARTAAELWSQPSTAGLAARDAFADTEATEALLASRAPATGIETDRSAAFLQWRYDFEPLHYRVWLLGDTVRHGVVVFRVRRRGPATEATVCDVIAPRGTSAGAVRRAASAIGRATGADYLLGAGPSVGLGAAFVPAPGLGPTLTWRTVANDAVPALADLSLVVGDLELF